MLRFTNSIILSNIIGHKIIFEKEVDSTNSWIKKNSNDFSNKNGLIIWADTQTNGRGQGSNRWESEKGKNLTFSFIIEPNKLEVMSQFLVSKFVSIAIAKFVSNYTKNVSIKWPNDIYVGDNKIAGVLIENTISGQYIFQSIIGIGLNVNQEIFSENIPNPISLKQLTNQEIKLDDSLNRLCKELDLCFKLLENKQYKKLDAAYHKQLYRLNQNSKFKIEENIVEAKIKGVDEFGCLMLEYDNKIEAFQHHEVKMII